MNIYSFIKTLSSNEQKLIENVFKQRQTSSRHKAKNSEYELFNFVFDSEKNVSELTDEFVFQSLSRWENIQALQKSKSRLLTIILDICCQDEYINNEKIVQEVERVDLKVKKKLLTCKVLYSKVTKNNHDLILHLLSEAETISKEYEFYEYLSEIYIYRMAFNATKTKQKEYEAACNAYQQYMELNKMKVEVNHFYLRFTNNLNLISEQSKSELTLQLEEVLQRVEKSNAHLLSFRVKYFYLLLKFAQCQLKQRFGDGIDLCLDLLSLLREKKFLDRKERRGMIYGNLANNLIYQRNFKKAARAAREAEAVFAIGTVNYVLIVEQEFLATFYDKDFKRAEECIQLMLKYTLGDSGQFRKDKYIYYKGWLEFVKGNYKEARKISQKKLLISEDKTGWDIGVRYLNILSLIMLSEFKTAKNAILALRKQIKRLQEVQESESVFAKASADKNENAKKVSDRDIEIANALHELSKEGFKMKSGSLNYKLIQLGDKKSDLSWQLFTHELVPINRWVRSYLNEYGGDSIVVEVENSNF